MAPKVEKVEQEPEPSRPSKIDENNPFAAYDYGGYQEDGWEEDGAGDGDDDFDYGLDFGGGDDQNYDDELDLDTGYEETGDGAKRRKL